jgi:TPR repeat protein
MAAQWNCSSGKLVKWVHYFKLSADQEKATGQVSFACCLPDGEGISVDLARAAPYLKLSADEGNALGQYHSGVCLRLIVRVPHTISMGHPFEEILRLGKAARLI